MRDQQRHEDSLKCGILERTLEQAIDNNYGDLTNVWTSTNNNVSILAHRR